MTETTSQPTQGKLFALGRRFLDQSKGAGIGITTPADLGKIIYDARKKQGFTQQQFADLAGVGRRFLSELENGKQSLEFGKVLVVAAAAGIDLVAKKR
jgi:y4mF family transcriptional regulator